MVSGNGAGAVEAKRPSSAWLSRRVKTKAPFVIIAVCAAIVVIVRVAWVNWGPELIINYTHSEPYGIYRVNKLQTVAYQRGMMVLLPVPESVKALVVERGWLNPGHPLMKQVGAIAGDDVCISDTEIEVNGASYGPIFRVDSLGRDMPKMRGCFTIVAGQFLPLSNFTEKSFDGRYIGPQPLAAVLGQVEPVWIF